MRESHLGYSPEETLLQVRLARTTGHELVREVAPIVDRAVANARGLWPEPAEREAAGFGCLVAMATLTNVTVDAPQQMILNLVGFFGQALVDDARAENPEVPDGD